jgi:hypothetical protein
MIKSRRIKDAPQIMAIIDYNSHNLSVLNPNLFVERNEALDKMEIDPLDSLDEETKNIVNFAWNLQNTVTPMLSADPSNSFIKSQYSPNFDINALNCINDIENSQNKVQEVSPNNHQIEDESRTINNDDSNSESSRMPSEGLTGTIYCSTDALFDKARELNKKLVVFNTKNSIELTIEDEPEFHKCKKDGLKINEEQTIKVNDALKNGQKMRKSSRKFIGDDDKEYEEMRKKNNKYVRAFRSKSKK